MVLPPVSAHLICNVVIEFVAIETPVDTFPSLHNYKELFELQDYNIKGDPASSPLLNSHHNSSSSSHSCTPEYHPLQISSLLNRKHGSTDRSLRLRPQEHEVPVPGSHRSSGLCLLPWWLAHLRRHPEGLHRQGDPADSLGPRHCE